MLPEKVRNTIENVEKQTGLTINGKYLLAVSGGMDSMAMVHIFSVLDMEFAIAHCNFQLRGQESNADQKFIEEYCKRNDIPFYTKTFDTTIYAKKFNYSIHEAARKLRYDFFEYILQKHQFNFIATAHHSDDNVETFFINTFRKSGLKGLTGIPILREKKILRPLLDISRSDINDYVKRKKIPYREDSSNLKQHYLRNKIRHNFIPLLRKWDERYISNTLDTISNLTDYHIFTSVKLNQFIDQNIKNYSPEVLRLKYSDLDTHPEDFFLFKLFLLDSGFNSAQTKSIVDNRDQLKTGNIFSGSDHTAFYDRGSLYLTSHSFLKEKIKPINWDIEKSNTLDLENGDRLKVSERPDQSHFHMRLNRDNICFPLKIRTWKRGDYFYPRGMNNHKKTLKKYFTDEKVPRFLKDRIPILSDQSDNVIAVLGMRADHRFLITDPSTTKKLIVNYSPAFWYPFFVNQGFPV